MKQPSQNEQGKKTNNQVTLATGRGGGGVAGLLVFGGALAVTGLIAVASFAAKKNKAKGPPHKPQSQQSDDTPPHNPSLQDSTPNHDNACFETSNTSKHQIDSYESVPCQTLILEEKPDLKVKTYVEEERATSPHQEIVLSDDSPPESTVSSNDHGIGEEFVESSIDSSYFKDVDRREYEELLKSVEINKGHHDDANSETEEREDYIVEENDDVTFETSGNSSEATGRPSLDSNEAAIWPAKLIEEEPQQVKEEMVHDQSKVEGMAKSNISRRFVKCHGGGSNSEFSEHAGNDKAMASAEAASCEKANLLYVALNHHLSVSKFKSWVIPLLLFASLLLVFFTHRNRVSGSSCAFDVEGGNSVISP